MSLLRLLAVVALHTVAHLTGGRTSPLLCAGDSGTAATISSNLMFHRLQSHCSCSLGLPPEACGAKPARLVAFSSVDPLNSVRVGTLWRFRECRRKGTDQSKVAGTRLSSCFPRPSGNCRTMERCAPTQALQPVGFMTSVRARRTRQHGILPLYLSQALHPATKLFATSKGGATTKNNRDSRPKFLGVKKYGGEFVVPGDIIVRQRGTRFKAGEGVMRGGDDSLMALTAGFVSMRRVQRNGKSTSRVKAGHLVSVKPCATEAVDPKRVKVNLIRVLATSWVKEQPE